MKARTEPMPKSGTPCRGVGRRPAIAARMRRDDHQLAIAAADGAHQQGRRGDVRAAGHACGDAVRLPFDQFAVSRTPAPNEPKLLTLRGLDGLRDRFAVKLSNRRLYRDSHRPRSSTSHQRPHRLGPRIVERSGQPEFVDAAVGNLFQQSSSQVAERPERRPSVIDRGGADLLGDAVQRLGNPAGDRHDVRQVVKPLGHVDHELRSHLT